MALRITVLASGRGSNLQALIDARGGALNESTIAVISDNPAAQALQRAQRHDIPTLVVARAQYAKRWQFEQALDQAIASTKPQLIVCAGYMRIIAASTVEAWRGKMINIHPSLLPLYPGLDTHRQVLLAGDREHGATVHFVTHALDAGPILARARMAVQSDDDPGSLAARLLPREHRLLVGCVELFARRTVELDAAGNIRIDDDPIEQPLEFDHEP